jgi:hypothetical protein
LQTTKIQRSRAPFLKELPEDLIEDENEKAKTPITPQDSKTMFAALRAALAES